MGIKIQLSKILYTGIRPTKSIQGDIIHILTLGQAAAMVKILTCWNFTLTINKEFFMIIDICTFP